MNLSEFLKQRRKENNLTQEDLAAKAGVGLRLVREIEQGKTTMRMDKVNQILDLFGAQLKVTPKTKSNVGITFPEKAITNEINNIITLIALQPSIMRATYF